MFCGSLATSRQVNLMPPAVTVRTLKCALNRASQARPYSLDRIVGASASMTAMRALLQKIAASPASTVLLTGESGTGKDLAAKVDRKSVV